MIKKSEQIKKKNNEIQSPKLLKVVRSFGHVDCVQNGAIYGWCYSGVVGKTSLVEFKVGDDSIGFVNADQYREDLDKVGYNNGICAFVWKIPAKYLNQEEDSVIGVFTELGEPLQNSPVVLHGSWLSEIDDLPSEDMRSDGNQLNFYNFFVHTKLRPDLNSKKRVLNGENKVSEGWSLSVNSKDVGHIFYWIGIAELFGSELVEPVIRIHAIKPARMVRVFGKFKRPNIFFIRPLVLYFYFGNNDKISTAIVKLHLTVRGASGIIRTLFSASISQFASTKKDFSLSIPADIINSMTMDAIDDASIVFEFSGNINIELGRFKFSAGRNYSSKNTLISDGFEDPVIENQYQAISGFFKSNEESLIDLNYRDSWKPLANQFLPEIIIPIFDALDYVEKCLNSVVETVSFPYLLTLIDDGSSQEVAIWLDKFAVDKPWVKVLHNQSNIGYTRAINRAVRESTGAAIVLLNSDTVVCSTWLEKLIYVAESDEKIGLVGPLSNAASWQSVPRLRDQDGNWEINEIPQNISLEDFVRKIESIEVSTYPSAPILNGFCLYIKRAVIETIGLFDEAAFPYGYGEENDYCIRAIDAGFDLRIAVNAYVYHAKTKSFGVERRTELIKGANVILRDRYGEERFADIERKFLAINELNSIRRQLIADEGISND